MVTGNEERCGYAVNKRIRGILALIVIICCFTLTGNTAYGATLKNIPGNDLSASSSNKLILGYHNYTAKWNGVAGKMIKGKYNYDLLCVPAKTTAASFTYTDFLDLTFTNIGKVNGRQLDARVHFNSMTVGKANTTTGLRSDKYFAACYLADESLWLSSTVDGIGAGYRASKTIDITTTIYWHDTGQTVNLPFFQCMQDIDAGANYFKESWEGKSGYSGVFYKYPACFLSFSGNKATTPSATDVGGTDSLFKGGFYAPTTGGVFRGAFTEGNSAAQFIPYSAYVTMSEPVKESDGREHNEEGDTITFTISQKIGKFYVDTMTVYSSFVIEDVIPEGLEYEKAAVFDAEGNDITSQGTLSYDSGTRKVIFSLGSTWLSLPDHYNGENIVMKISTKVMPLDAPLKKVKNKAYVTIDKEVKLTSGETEDVLAVPYHANYKYVSGTEGKVLPEEISTSNGKYAVKDESKYYQGDKVLRKDAPAEGSAFKILDEDGNLKGSWVLQWDAAEKKIENSDVAFTGTWGFVHAPRLIITKKISSGEDSFTDAHGEPVFIFKLTGEDSGKTWYKSFAFTKEARDAVEKNGNYTDDEGIRFEKKNGFIYAVSDYIYLPEDDYVAEEVNTIRFSTASAESYYIKEDGSKVQSDISQGTVKIPLKMSSYKEIDAGFDAKYAGICFENSKTRWDKLSHTDIIINKLKGADHNA